MISLKSSSSRTMMNTMMFLSYLIVGVLFVVQEVKGQTSQPRTGIPRTIPAFVECDPLSETNFAVQIFTGSDPTQVKVDLFMATTDRGVASVTTDRNFDFEPDASQVNTRGIAEKAACVPYNEREFDLVVTDSGGDGYDDFFIRIWMYGEMIIENSDPFTGNEMHFYFRTPYPPSFVGCIDQPGKTMVEVRVYATLIDSDPNNIGEDAGSIAMNLTSFDATNPAAQLVTNTVPDIFKQGMYNMFRYCIQEDSLVRVETIAESNVDITLIKLHSDDCEVEGLATVRNERLSSAGGVDLGTNRFEQYMLLQQCSEIASSPSHVPSSPPSVAQSSEPTEEVMIPDCNWFETLFEVEIFTGSDPTQIKVDLFMGTTDLEFDLVPEADQANEVVKKGICVGFDQEFDVAVTDSGGDGIDGFFIRIYQYDQLIIENSDPFTGSELHFYTVTPNPFMIRPATCSLQPGTQPLDVRVYATLIENDINNIRENANITAQINVFDEEGTQTNSTTLDGQNVFRQGMFNIFRICISDNTLVNVVTEADSNVDITFIHFVNDACNVNIRQQNERLFPLSGGVDLGTNPFTQQILCEITSPEPSLTPSSEPSLVISSGPTSPTSDEPSDVSSHKPTSAPSSEPIEECMIETGLNCTSVFNTHEISCDEIEPEEEPACVCPECVREVKFKYTSRSCESGFRTVGKCVDNAPSPFIALYQVTSCVNSSIVFATGEVMQGDFITISQEGVSSDCLPECLSVSIEGPTGAVTQSFEIDSECDGGNGLVLLQNYGAFESNGYICSETDTHNCIQTVTYNVSVCNTGTSRKEQIYAWSLTINGDAIDLVDDAPPMDLMLLPGECYYSDYKTEVNRCLDDSTSVNVAANASNPLNGLSPSCNGFDELKYDWTAPSPSPSSVGSGYPSTGISEEPSLSAKPSLLSSSLTLQPSQSLSDAPTVAPTQRDPCVNVPRSYFDCKQLRFPRHKTAKRCNRRYLGTKVRNLCPQICRKWLCRCKDSPYPFLIPGRTKKRFYCNEKKLKNPDCKKKNSSGFRIRKICPVRCKNEDRCVGAQ